MKTVYPLQTKFAGGIMKICIVVTDVIVTLPVYLFMLKALCNV